LKYKSKTIPLEGISYIPKLTAAPWALTSYDLLLSPSIGVAPLVQRSEGKWSDSTFATAESKTVGEMPLFGMRICSLVVDLRCILSNRPI
jgi:hypothetical protein